jgi:hypothetical protein
MEDHLKDYLEELKKDSKSAFLKRYLCSVFCSYFVYLIPLGFYESEVLFIIVFSLLYKFQYFQIQNKVYLQRNQIDKDFPLFLKMLEMHIQTVPVRIAIKESSNYVCERFRKDLLILVDESLQDINSLDPYLKLSQKYCQIDDFDKVMRLLFRLNDSSLKQQSKMLRILSTVSSYRMRRRIESRFEKRIKALSMIGIAPVVILASAYIISLIINI